MIAGMDMLVGRSITVQIMPVSVTMFADLQGVPTCKIDVHIDLFFFSFLWRVEGERSWVGLLLILEQELILLLSTGSFEVHVFSLIHVMMLIVVFSVLTAIVLLLIFMFKWTLSVTFVALEVELKTHHQRESDSGIVLSPSRISSGIRIYYVRMFGANTLLLLVTRRRSILL